ncbi:hypothetical protein SGODD07_00076 [Streptococcus gordonii]|uniref:Uncharacterized protein n=1 Tax=Streptococcus gordonii TaxID=1302 RepID=A0A139NFT1_STRGN|nr:hypothetical protein SGODD07_00076 [Streptococcus gordonii]
MTILTPAALASWIAEKTSGVISFLLFNKVPSISMATSLMDILFSVNKSIVFHIA